MNPRTGRNGDVGRTHAAAPPCASNVLVDGRPKPRVISSRTRGTACARTPCRSSARARHCAASASAPDEDVRPWPLRHPPARDIERRVVALFQSVAVVALAGALVACGGGGGGSGDPAASPPPAPAPAPSVAPGPLAAVMSVAAPSGYDSNRLAAFDRLNEIRRSAGLGLLAQDASLDQAAQAHAAWEIANDQWSHQETAGTPGFTGVDWWDRDVAVGYRGSGGEEVLTNGASSGAAAVDVLVNMIYHRAALLQFRPVDVGIGYSGASAAHVQTPVVIDFTTPADGSARSHGQTAQAGLQAVAIWPLDGAEGVWTHLGNESPNPVPAQSVLSLGTPVSISVDDASTLRVATFSLTNAATGAVVPAASIDHDGDATGLVPASFAGLVPTVALDPQTRYRVDFTGSAVSTMDGTLVAIARSWTFTTGTVAFAPPD